MRKLSRIKKILRMLEKLWNEYPDMRLGQLLENFIFVKGERGDNTSVMLFYQEDDDTEEIIELRLKLLEMI